jgi:hypothetical protein
MTEQMTQAQINIRARYFYLGCVAIFVLRLLSSSLFSQLSQPVLIDPGIDTTYWLFHLLGIPHALTHSMIWSAVLDISLFLLVVIASLMPGRRMVAFLFTLLVLIYQITYSTYAAHHYHSLIGVLFLSIPFWFGPGLRFTYLWEAARYYFFFIFSSAALWKVSSGALFIHGQMSAILMSQHAQMVYDYPGTGFSHFHSYLIAHEGVAMLLLWAGFLTQLSFLGGFFTRKYDRIYLILFLLFFAMDYLVMHITSIGLLILCLVLLDWDKIEKGRRTRGERDSISGINHI